MRSTDHYGWAGYFRTVADLFDETGDEELAFLARFYRAVGALEWAGAVRASRVGPALRPRLAGLDSAQLNVLVGSLEQQADYHDGLESFGASKAAAILRKIRQLAEEYLEIEREIVESGGLETIERETVHLERRLEHFERLAGGD